MVFQLDNGLVLTAVADSRPLDDSGHSFFFGSKVSSVSSSHEYISQGMIEIRNVGLHKFGNYSLDGKQKLRNIYKCKGIFLIRFRTTVQSSIAQESQWLLLLGSSWQFWESLVNLNLSFTTQISQVHYQAVTQLSP